MSGTSTVDQVVTSYLDRLERAAATLPPERRAELLDEIGGHISAARAAGAAADEAAVRTLLDRLGEPEEIVAAASDDEPRPGLAPLPSRWGGLEIAALLLLGLGGFLFPVVPAVIGFALVLLCRAWTRRQKVVGGLLLLAPLLPFGLYVTGKLLVPGTELVLVAMAVVGPLLSAAYLAVSLSLGRRP